MGARQPLGGETQQGFKLGNNLDPPSLSHPLQSSLTKIAVSTEPVSGPESKAASTEPIEFAENERSLGLERERHLSAPAAHVFPWVSVPRPHPSGSWAKLPMDSAFGLRKGGPKLETPHRYSY